MAERFSMEHAEARALAQRMVAHGETLANAQRTLADRLEELRGCWGPDQFGRSFADGKWKGSGAALESAGTLAETDVTVGTVVGEIVDEFKRTDEGNAEELDRLQAANVEGWSK